MTQEDKELLLKYLSMALPYGVKVLNNMGRTYELTTATAYLIGLYSNNGGYVETPRPYLRSMLSMTDEEKGEMHNLLSPEGTAIYENNGIALPINHYGEYVPYELMNSIIQYLLKKHFDFIGLISKGLAIEAPKDMYNIK